MRAPPICAAVVLEDVGLAGRDDEADLRRAGGEHALDEMLADRARPLDRAVEAAADRQQLLRKRQRLNPRARARRRNDAPHVVLPAPASNEDALEFGGAPVPPCARRASARAPPGDRRSSSSGRSIAAIASSVDVRDENLPSRLEELLQPRPGIREDRRAARGRFEQPARRTVAGSAIGRRVTLSVSRDEQ